jgi:putative tryptophan/tyrosine transport system substrate-binding protein
MSRNTRVHGLESRRRWLAAGVAGAAGAWMGALRAQAKAPVVIGWLDTSSPDRARDMLSAFSEGMVALGWKLGEHYVLEQRHADARTERLPALAQELAARHPAVIVATPSAAVVAAAAAAPTTPVVRAGGDSPLTGLVQSLARPGGMVTGVSSNSDDTSLKVLEMLVESVPNLRRVGFLADSTSRGRDENVGKARSSAERLRIEAVVVDLARPQDVEPGLARLAKTKVQAVVVLPSSWFSGSAIAEAAWAQRLPVVGGVSMGVSQGGLFGYGYNRLALARRSAYYVDRILKGAKPGDLPIEQPTTFELVINLKTAKALGITIPPSMMVRATRVIE